MSIFSVALESDRNRTWLSLPATAEELNKALLDINALDKGYSIGDCKTSTTLPLRDFVVGGDINEVNYLAARLAALPPTELAMLEAVMESPARFETMTQVIDFTYNVDYFCMVPGIRNAEDLAQYYIFDSGMVDMPHEWKSGIDLYAFGINIEQLEKGMYTSKGYLLTSGDEWKKVYENSHVVPPENRVDNYLKNAEQSVEQNYDQIDGIINNEGPRPANLTDGQTYDEVKELAPETLSRGEEPTGKPSILAQLREAKHDIAKPGTGLEKDSPDIDL